MQAKQGRNVNERRKAIAQQLYRQVEAWKERGKLALEAGNRKAAENAAAHISRILERLRKFSQTGKL
jgi:hypothetical protein